MSKSRMIMFHFEYLFSLAFPYLVFLFFACYFLSHVAGVMANDQIIQTLRSKAMANDQIRSFSAIVLALIFINLIDETFCLLAHNPINIILFLFLSAYIYNFLGATPSVFSLSGFLSGFLNTSRRSGVHKLLAKELELKPPANQNLGEENKYWMRDVPQSESRFTEAAELLQVTWFEIKGTLKWEQLSVETNYAAHLIFKTTLNSTGLDTFQEASVSVGSLQRKRIVSINPRLVRSRDKSIGLPIKRCDGWMEMELGQFYCDGGTGEVVISFSENSHQNELKSGLIVAGIEVRPI